MTSKRTVPSLFTLSSDRGFTLVEVLVSVAVLAVIVAMLSTLATSTLDTWNRNRGRLAAVEAKRPLEQAVLMDLGQRVTGVGLPQFPDDPEQAGESLFGFYVATQAEPGTGRPLAYVLYEWSEPDAELTRQTRSYNWNSDPSGNHVPPFGGAAPDPASDPNFLAQPPVPGVLAWEVTFQDEAANVTAQYDPSTSRYIRLGWVQCSPDVARMLADRGQLDGVVDALDLTGSAMESPFLAVWESRIVKMVDDGVLSPDLSSALQIGQVIRPIGE